MEALRRTAITCQGPKVFSTFQLQVPFHSPVAIQSIPDLNIAVMAASKREAEAQVRSWGFGHVFTWSDGPYVTILTTHRHLQLTVDQKRILSPAYPLWSHNAFDPEWRIHCGLSGR